MYKDDNGQLLQRSVISGLSKNSINHDEALSALFNLLDWQEVIK